MSLRREGCCIFQCLSWTDSAFVGCLYFSRIIFSNYLEWSYQGQGLSVTRFMLNYYLNFYTWPVKPVSLLIVDVLFRAPRWWTILVTPDADSLIASLMRAATWQNQTNDSAPSEDSDQPGHPPSLIRVFAVRMNPMSAQRRLWSDWADNQADLSLRWAHTYYVGFVMSRLMWSTCMSICAPRTWKVHESYDIIRVQSV